MILYDKLSYDLYNKRLDSFSSDERLRKLGFSRSVLGYTHYGYPIDLISVGFGPRDIFVVGGTHSSEIISVDFVLQLINNLPNFSEFDPNIFTIKFIPIQNPEGFDICTSTFSSIDSIDFQSKSKEYFLRYRTDSLIFKVVNGFNKLFDDCSSASVLYDRIRSYINNDINWKNLSDKRAMPNITIFNTLVNSYDGPYDFDSLFQYLCYSCNVTLDKIDTLELHDSFLYFFMNILKDKFVSLYPINLVKYQKLHQKMFDDVSIDIRSDELKKKMLDVYDLPDNPRGSIVTHDSTGLLINLNANHELNPGISVIKNSEFRYGYGPRSNVRNYYPGPIGLPCSDVNNFEYAVENKLLFDLIKSSYDNGRYFSTFLYHGTGGMIYYNPYDKRMSSTDFNNYFQFNNEIVELYNSGISSVSSSGYRKLDDSGDTGYGDMLRRTFPGVLLVELSRMGGNPISPYGDINNINNTMNENFAGFREFLKYYSNQKIKSI